MSRAKNQGRFTLLESSLFTSIAVATPQRKCLGAKTPILPDSRQVNPLSFLDEHSKNAHFAGQPLYA